MCKVPVKLRELVKQRLAAAAEEIFELLERTITEYEEELVSRYETQKNHETNQETPGMDQETLRLELSRAVVVLTPVVPVVTPEAPDLTAGQTENDVPEEAQEPEEPEEPPHLHILNTLCAVKQEPLQWSIPGAPDLTAGHTENDLPEDAQISEEPQEAPHLTLSVIKEEPLQWSITQPFNKEETCNISISSSLSLPPSSPSDVKQEPHQTGLDFVKTEKKELKPLTQEPPQSNLNTAPGDDEGEEDMDHWEYEGLMPSPQSPSEETENSSEEEEEKSPPAKKRTLNMRLNTNNIEGSPREANSKAEKGKMSDETENSSDDNTDSEAESANKDEEKPERPDGNILQIKNIKFVSNNVIKVLNVEVKKPDKMSASAVNDTEASTSDPHTKRNLRKRKNAGKTAKTDGDSDFESKKQVHSCSRCSKGFDSLVKLKAHERTHAAVNVRCPFCSKIFKGKSFLKRHMKVHQTEKKTKEKNPTERRTRTDAKFITKTTLETEDTDTDKTKDSSDEN